MLLLIYLLGTTKSLLAFLLPYLILSKCIVSGPVLTSVQSNTKATNTTNTHFMTLCIRLLAPARPAELIFVKRPNSQTVITCQVHCSVYFTRMKPCDESKRHVCLAYVVIHFLFSFPSDRSRSREMCGEHWICAKIVQRNCVLNSLCLKSRSCFETSVMVECSRMCRWW